MREVDNGIEGSNGILILNNQEQGVPLGPAPTFFSDDLSIGQSINDNDNYSKFGNVLHILEWYSETMTFNRDSQHIHREKTKRFWLTDQLVEGISSFNPTRDVIRVNSTLDDCIRDLVAFKKKCGTFFLLDVYS